eukprot:4577586-Prymnesium_polylepis.2
MRAALIRPPQAELTVRLCAARSVGGLSFFPTALLRGSVGRGCFILQLNLTALLHFVEGRYLEGSRPGVTRIHARITLPPGTNAIHITVRLRYKGNLRSARDAVALRVHFDSGSQEYHIVPPPSRRRGDNARRPRGAHGRWGSSYPGCRRIRSAHGLQAQAWPHGKRTCRSASSQTTQNVHGKLRQNVTLPIALAMARSKQVLPGQVTGCIADGGDNGNGADGGDSGNGGAGGGPGGSGVVGGAGAEGGRFSDTRRSTCAMATVLFTTLGSPPPAQ